MENPSNQCGREKLWVERNTDEKLEALRQNLTYAMLHIEEMRDTIQTLTCHQHAANGDLLTKMNHDNDRPPGYRRHYTPVSLRDKE